MSQIVIPSSYAMALGLEDNLQLLPQLRSGKKGLQDRETADSITLIYTSTHQD